MNIHQHTGFYVYLVLSVVSLLIGISGTFVLKNNLKYRESDIVGLYGSIIVVLAAIIGFLYCILHVFMHA